MEASSEARAPVPGGSKCVDDRGEDERSEELRDGMEGSVSIAGGAVYMVDWEPVDVRERMDGTVLIEGTGESDRPGSVGDDG